ncbi:hypothetical protein VTK56DRAFT_2942 [Thermocarpiscus australiensis]
MELLASSPRPTQLCLWRLVLYGVPKVKYLYPYLRYLSGSLGLDLRYSPVGGGFQSRCARRDSFLRFTNLTKSVSSAEWKR